jgi:peptide/nickel transport system substrate-binding protein
MKKWRLVLGTFLAIGLVTTGCSTDGETNADSVKYTARNYPESGPAPCADGATGLAQIQSIDKETVAFVLCAPDPAFLKKLALMPLTINDSGYLQSHVLDGSINTMPNGTGPLKFDAWAVGDSITLSKYDGYWGTKSLAQTVVFQWQSEASARLIALQSGTADAIGNISPSDYAIVEANPSLRLVPRAPLGVSFLGFNSTYKPFDDIRVRKAIALAIDRERILKNFYPVGSSVAPQFTPCSIDYACVGDTWYDTDIDEAKRLLADAGFPDGFETTLSYREVARTHTPYPLEIATDIQDQLLAVGIKVVLDSQESATFISNQAAGKIEGLFLSGFNADYPDPTNFMDFFFGATSADRRFGDKSPELTAPIALAAQESDPAKRAALYAEANNALKSLVRTIPLIHGASAAAFQADVTGFHTSPLEVERLALMSPGDRQTLVWILGVEPSGLYCADESDGDIFRVCAQIMEGLYGFKEGTTAVEPRLAKSCSVSDDLLTWTCSLQSNVTFHNGARFDASDVLDSFAVIWDCAHPLHKGRTNVFKRWTDLSGFLNPDACGSK